MARPLRRFALVLVNLRWPIPAALLAVLLAMGAIADAARKQSGEVSVMDTVFQAAAASRGDPYLEAESQLRDGGTAAAEVLQGYREHPEPIARLLATTLLKWVRGQAPEYQAALEYLEYIPKRLAKTPVGAPPPTGVANELGERFGGRAADFLALRLVKETDWPRWKSLGVLLYLQRQTSPITTAALLRFVADSDDAEMRRFGAEAITAIDDPDLAGKLAVERARLEAQRRPLPAELRDLAR